MIDKFCQILNSTPEGSRRLFSCISLALLASFMAHRTKKHAFLSSLFRSSILLVLPHLAKAPLFTTPFLWYSPASFEG